MERMDAFRPQIATVVIRVRPKDKPTEKAQPVGCAFSVGFIIGARKTSEKSDWS